MNENDKINHRPVEEVKLLQALIDCLPDQIYVKDTKCRFVLCNKATAEITRFKTPEELIGKTDFDTCEPEDARNFYEEEQQIIKTGVPLVNHELVTVNREGQTFWTLVTKLPRRDDSGNIIGIVGSNRSITEHKKAQFSLLESEARYKAIFNSAKEGILVADIETKCFKYANPAICRMFGFAVDEWQKLGVPDIHPKEAVPLVMSEFEAQARGEKTLSTNIPCLRKDGVIFYADINSTNVIIDNRPCNVGLFIDITERKNTEEALRESEQRYRLLVEQLPAVTYTAAMDEASTTLYVSPQVKEILGVSPDDYKADTDLWRKLLHSDDRDRVIGEVERCHRMGSSFSCEYRMVTKDGRVVWIRDEARIVKNSEGRPMYLQGVMYNITEHKNAEKQLREAHDELEARVLQRTTDLAQAVEKLQQEITERKRAEESLRKAEHRFRTIFENTAVGLYRTTPEGRILLANPALVKMMGYRSFKELTQLNLEREGIDSSTPRSIFKKQIEKKGRIIGLESIWIKRDGSRLFVSESAVAVKDEQGDILYYEGTVQDITKRKEAEEKLMHYQEQLRSLASQLSLAEEQLRRRIATELHDHISQNLAISKMKLDSLMDSAAGSEQDKTLREIADTLAQTIETTRSLTFEISPPVLYELGFVAAVNWLARQTKRRFGLDVRFADDGKSKKLDADVRVLLFQAVRELLVNIVKHAEANKAYISIKKVRDNVRIIVEDDGVGFDASAIGANDYTKGGFGLFNIRERIDLVGGKVEIQSSPGNGTKITLTAPLLKSSKASKKIRKNRS